MVPVPTINSILVDCAIQLHMLHGGQYPWQYPDNGPPQHAPQHLDKSKCRPEGVLFRIMSSWHLVYVEKIIEGCV